MYKITSPEPWESFFDVDNLKKRVAELEKKTLNVGFWNNQKEAKKTVAELNKLKEKVAVWERLEKQAKELKEKAEVLDILACEAKVARDKEECGKIEKELEAEYQAVLAKFKKEKIKFLFSDRFDHLPAILNFYAGAGGRDAEDWASILLRMYIKFAEKNKWQPVILHQHLNEEAGVKNASLEIKGKYAYGYLKNESGTHRLVRISPYSAQKLRHTSFALIEVLPYIKEDEANIEIKESDLKIELSKSSGPGGQNVNKRETAVRIIHIPTGIAAACQNERSQAQNKEKALELLKGKIIHLLEKEKEKEISALKGKRIKPEWGSQIRSYVLHPYKMVKDHRTGMETTHVEKVLDGELDEFVEAEMKS